jgi:hypothetical protein
MTANSFRSAAFLASWKPPLAAAASVSIVLLKTTQEALEKVLEPSQQRSRRVSSPIVMGDSLGSYRLPGCPQRLDRLRCFGHRVRRFVTRAIQLLETGRRRRLQHLFVARNRDGGPV